MPEMTIREELVYVQRKGVRRGPYGPYRYGYWREGGRVRKKYLGKVTGRAEDEEPDFAARLLANDEVPDWWCLDLLGCLAGDSFTVRRAKYREKIRACCPHSGCYNERKYQLYRRAWDVIRKGRR